MQALLDAGVSPDTFDDWGELPLKRAAERENLAVVRMLLDAGADPSGIDASGDPVLMTAIERDDVTVVRALLDAGAEPNAVGVRWDEAALVRAVTYETVFFVGTPLVEARSYADVPSTRTLRLLQSAGDPKLRHRTKELLDAGASVDDALALAVRLQKRDRILGEDLLSAFDVDSAIPVLLEVGADLNGLLVSAVKRGDG